MTITLYELPQYFVAQHNSTEFVSIRGSYAGTGNVECAVFSGSTQITPWTLAKMNPDKKLFSYLPDLAIGGLYIVKARMADNPSAVSAQNYGWSVGHQIHIIGQSNGEKLAAGTAALTSGICSQYTSCSNRFSPQNDGYILPSGYGHVSLINQLATHSSAPINILNACVPGSSILDWQSVATNSNKGMYKSMLFQNGRDTRIIVWIQGEADMISGMSRATYLSNLTNLYGFLSRNIRRSGDSLKFIICPAGWHNAAGAAPIPQSQIDAIRDAQSDFIAATSGAILGPDLLNYPYDNDNADGWHLKVSSTGYGAFAADLADVIAPYLV